MDTRLPSFEITSQGAYYPQSLLCDGIKMNEMRKKRSSALCGTSLCSSTSSLEMSKYVWPHLQDQRCRADRAVSFVRCSTVKSPSLLVSVETIDPRCAVSWVSGSKSHSFWLVLTLLSSKHKIFDFKNVMDLRAFKKNIFFTCGIKSRLTGKFRGCDYSLVKQSWCLEQTEGKFSQRSFMMPVALQACKLLFLWVILVLMKHSQAGPFALPYFSKSLGFRLSSWRESNEYVVGYFTTDSNRNQKPKSQFLPK